MKFCEFQIILRSSYVLIGAVIGNVKENLNIIGVDSSNLGNGSTISGKCFSLGGLYGPNCSESVVDSIDIDPASIRGKCVDSDEFSKNPSTALGDRYFFEDGPSTQIISAKTPTIGSRMENGVLFLTLDYKKMIHDLTMDEIKLKLTDDRLGGWEMVQDGLHVRASCDNSKTGEETSIFEDGKYYVSTNRIYGKGAYKLHMTPKEVVIEDGKLAD